VSELTESHPKEEKGRWGDKNLLIRGGTAATLYKGSLIAHRIGSQLVEVPDSANKRTDLVCVGVLENEPVITTATGDNSEAVDGDGNAIKARVRAGIRGPFDTGSGGDEITIADIDKRCFMFDSNTLYKTDLSTTLSPAGTVAYVDDDGGVYVNIDDAPIVHLIGDGAALLTTFEDSLADDANGSGASLVGVEDAGGFTTADDVEGVLAELLQNYYSARGGYIPLPLSVFREVNSTGDVGDTTANGGVLASDTTPVLDAVATSNEWEILWATGDVDPIGVSVILPSDFDDTADALLDLVVASGSTNAASIVCASAWSAGAAGTEVSDTADDSGTKSATPHTITATISNGDIPAGARRVTIRLTPPSHSTNAISLKAAGIAYKRKKMSS
jgi:hypothetical protein